MSFYQQLLKVRGDARDDRFEMRVAHIVCEIKSKVILVAGARVPMTHVTMKTTGFDNEIIREVVRRLTLEKLVVRVNREKRELVVDVDATLAI